GWRTHAPNPRPDDFGLAAPGTSRNGRSALSDGAMDISPGSRPLAQEGQCDAIPGMYASGIFGIARARLAASTSRLFPFSARRNNRELGAFRPVLHQVRG